MAEEYSVDTGPIPATMQTFPANGGNQGECQFSAANTYLSSVKQNLLSKSKMGYLGARATTPGLHVCHTLTTSTIIFEHAMGYFCSRSASATINFMFQTPLESFETIKMFTCVLLLQLCTVAPTTMACFTWQVLHTNVQSSKDLGLYVIHLFKQIHETSFILHCDQNIRSLVTN